MRFRHLARLLSRSNKALRDGIQLSEAMTGDGAAIFRHVCYMPTGTRRSISAKSVIKPIRATASVLIHSTVFRGCSPSITCGSTMSSQVRTAMSKTAETSPIHATAKNGHVGRLRSNVRTLSA